MIYQIPLECGTYFHSTIYLNHLKIFIILILVILPRYAVALLVHHLRRAASHGSLLAGDRGTHKGEPRGARSLQLHKVHASHRGDAANTMAVLEAEYVEAEGLGLGALGRRLGQVESEGWWRVHRHSSQSMSVQRSTLRRTARATSTASEIIDWPSDLSAPLSCGPCCAPWTFAF